MDTAQYTLTATNSYGSASKTALVNTYGGQPSGSTFYFAVDSGGSCFVLAIYAQNASQAQQLAVYENGGTATPISAAQFDVGQCP
jgi:hypothetical protein